MIEKAKFDPKTKPATETQPIKAEDKFQPIVLTPEGKVSTIYDPLSGVTYILNEAGKIIGRETDR